MPNNKTQPSQNQNNVRLVTEEQRALDLKKKTYRERALQIHPWICAKCGREFTGKKLRELTVHHKDHNHDNNPPDGSNWELLCLYCHDNAHSRSLDADWLNSPDTGDTKKQTATYNPFAAIKDLLSQKK
ncbi:MAG: YajD family HNH nuclease [Proteobacteria bacterium]|nr:HNH nuclease family protein [Desulfobulbaceae bacterium]MBU4151998.1 YajD family HNH nuclease [Pseudomonadota bacterium]MDP2104687.1 YajD family HNH nuclease [Desulfobulbaceae bacterium]